MTTMIEAAPSAVREFKPVDRCDRCGARAYAAAIKGGSELLFCAHHASKHYDVLLDQGFEVQENFELITDET